MRDETEKREETREGTSARVPCINKPVKKRKCWRPLRKGKEKSGAFACRPHAFACCG